MVPTTSNPKLQPEPHGSLVGAHHEVELHGAKATLRGIPQRVFAHGGRDTLAARIRSRRVTAVCDMRAAAALIGVQIVGSRDAALHLGDEHVVARGKPVIKRFRPAPLARQSIGLAGLQDRIEDRPDCPGISLQRWPDEQTCHGWIALPVQTDRAFARAA